MPHDVVGGPARSGSGPASQSGTFTPNAVDQLVEHDLVDILLPNIWTRSLAERIQRRIVSGFLPASLAASGTVDHALTVPHEDVVPCYMCV